MYIIDQLDIPLPLQAAVKIMAKDLVRTRNHIKKFHMMRANVQGISLKLTVWVGVVKGVVYDI